MQTDHHNFHGLLHSADLIEAELRRQLAPLGIQPRQARVLEAVGRMGRSSQADLASAFGVTAASMSTMTDRLLAAGYITRAVDPASRRQNALELTDKGRTLLGGIDEAWAAVDDCIRDALGTDAATFFDLARQLRDSLGGTIPGTYLRGSPAMTFSTNTQAESLIGLDGPDTLSPKQEIRDEIARLKASGMNDHPMILRRIKELNWMGRQATKKGGFRPPRRN